jgi:hypothetical protein
MSGQHTEHVYSYNAASANITENAVVVISGADGADMPSGADVKSLGVALETPRGSGYEVAVQTAGVAKCVAAGAISVGASVAINGTNGRVKSVTPASGSTLRFVVGEAQTAASNAGDIVYVLLRPFSYIGA